MKVIAYLFYIGEDYYIYKCYDFQDHFYNFNHKWRNHFVNQLIETPHGLVDESDLN